MFKVKKFSKAPRNRQTQFGQAGCNFPVANIRQYDEEVRTQNCPKSKIRHGMHLFWIQTLLKDIRKWMEIDQSSNKTYFI